MDFFSCPCLLSEPADWIKGIGFPQTLRVINISADQMQNTADPQHRSEDSCNFSSVVFWGVFFWFTIIYTETENPPKKRMRLELKLC